MRLQENGEVWVSWFVGYFIRIISTRRSAGAPEREKKKNGNLFIIIGKRYLNGIYEFSS